MKNCINFFSKFIIFDQNSPNFRFCRSDIVKISQKSINIDISEGLANRIKITLALDYVSIDRLTFSFCKDTIECVQLIVNYVDVTNKNK